MSAIARWNEQVSAHHAQSIRTQEQTGWTPEADFWRPFTRFFRTNPDRTDDPVVNRLLREVGPQTTVLDVGGGAGRFALPLARHCQKVTVVEPSTAMLEELRAVATQAGITNVEVVQATWEEATVEPADVVLCAHVVYAIDDIAPFLQKLAAHARSTVLLLAFFEGPQAHLAPLWERLHGEPRINLPGFGLLLPVLWEMAIFPNLEMIPAGPPEAFADPAALLHQLRQRLYIRPATELDQRLQAALPEFLLSTPDGLRLRNDRPRRLGLLSWRTTEP